MQVAILALDLMAKSLDYAEYAEIHDLDKFQYINHHHLANS